MGDPLSIAASVASLLSLGLQNTEYLYKFYTTYRDRDNDLARTADQLGDLLHSLEIIDNIVRTRKWRNDEQGLVNHIEKSLKRCEDVITGLQDETQKFKKEPTADVRKVIVVAGRRVTYPFRRSTLEKLSEDIDEFRSNLSIALDALQLKEHRNTQNDIEELKHINQKAQALNVAANLRQWLKAPDVTIDYNDACSKRHPGTGQWFVKSPAFTNWLQQENAFLWLYGFAGCGKAVLCSTAIQHAFRHQRADDGSAVAFFFFKFDDESKQESSAVLRALLLQLCGQVKGLETELTRLQSNYNRGMPPVSTLMEHLRQAIARCRNVFILLDALDESPEDTTRPEVLSIIETLRQWHLPSLHLLVTSQDAPDIRRCLDVQKDVRHTDFVALKNGSIDQDILNYVSYQVDHERGLRRWNDADRQQIKDHLSRHAGGVFRWVKCQLDPLKKCAQSKKYLEHCLRTLPPSLDKTYERMLCNIGEESQDDAQRILSLLCYARRPLSVNEVIEAIAVDIDNLECYDHDRKFNNAADLSSVCPGLIEITSNAHTSENGNNEGERFFTSDSDSQYWKFRKHAQLVRIGHFSVQKYLLSDRIKRSPAAHFALVGPTEHTRISKTCLLYLENEDIWGQNQTPQLLKRYPLTQYAAQYWYVHYQHAEEKLVQQLLTKVITLFTSSRRFNHWIRLYDADRLSILSCRHGKITWDRPSPIYYAALLGLDGVLLHMLPQSCADINAPMGKHGSLLNAASENGHEHIVQILLEKGVNVDVNGGLTGSTALQQASHHGYEEIVKMLLNQGADVKKGGSNAAIHSASIQGHPRIVQMLLDKGAGLILQHVERATRHCKVHQMEATPR